MQCWAPWPILTYLDEKSTKTLCKCNKTTRYILTNPSIILCLKYYSPTVADSKSFILDSTRLYTRCKRLGPTFCHLQQSVNSTLVQFILCVLASQFWMMFCKSCPQWVLETLELKLRLTHSSALWKPNFIHEKA